ncbi:MAG: hypothetical protein MJB14_23055, partial [Spirochaetes bacterium]|nr:hypothetical protein [Spirochaetota bacterium]
MKGTKQKAGKKMDLEMLIFFFIIAAISFVFYLLKHPVTTNWSNPDINQRALKQIYLFDLVLLSVFMIGYLIVLFLAMLYLVIYRKELTDNLFLFLFFPLFGFFSKSMMLPEIYADHQLFSIIKDNLVF